MARSCVALQRRLAPWSFASSPSPPAFACFSSSHSPVDVRASGAASAVFGQQAPPPPLRRPLLAQQERPWGRRWPLGTDLSSPAAAARRGFYRNTHRPGRFVSLDGLPARASFVVTSLDDVGRFPVAAPETSVEASLPHQRELTMRARGSLFFWLQRPRTALIVKKSFSPETAEMARSVVEYLRDRHGIRALIDAKDAKELPDLESFEPAHLGRLNTVVDFVVSLGGDGTLLHVSSLFQGHTPPVVGFSMGTLGFLVPFRPEEYREALDSVVQGGFRFMKRMRLECQLYDFSSERGKFRVNSPSIHVLNEMTIHGETSRLSLIDCYVNDVLLARYQSDGIIASTSTGSTAYSLSCSGSLIHPGQIGRAHV